MSKRLLIFAVCPFLFWSCARIARFVDDSPPAILGEFYTQVNMWVEYPKPILSSNYHMGEMIPLGSLVTLTAANARDIKFTCNGRQFILRHERRHTFASIGELQNRMFKTTNPLESDAFTSLTPAQQADVRAGSVTVGMPKEAMLMSYGFPPEHETSSTAANVWVYWRSKFAPRKSVTFTDGKVSSTIGF